MNILHCFSTYYEEEESLPLINHPPDFDFDTLYFYNYFNSNLSTANHLEKNIYVLDCFIPTPQKSSSLIPYYRPMSPDDLIDLNHMIGSHYNITHCIPLLSYRPRPQFVYFSKIKNNKVIEIIKINGIKEL